ncbi:MAG: hypothetical protein HFH38_08780 [Lachnospiraceae bacterium]|nr:hypothetical protein [Lachnospiraceae bacterium]
MIDKVSNQKYYEYSKINQQRRETTESSGFHMDPGDQGVIYERGSQKKSEKPKGAAAEKDAPKASAQARPGVKVEISRQGYRKTGTKQQGASLAEGVQKYVAIAIGFLKSLWDKIWNEKTEVKQEGFPEILEGKLSGQDGTGETAAPQDGTSFFGGMEPQESSGSAQGAAGSGASFFGGMEPQESSGSAQGAAGSGASFFGGIGSQEAAAKPAAVERPAYTQEEIRRIFRRGNRQEIEDFLSNHGERRLAKNTELLTQYDRRGSIIGIDHAQKELILFGDKNEIRL